MTSKKCSLLWNHTRLKVDGSVLPCCRFDADKITNKDIAIPMLSDGIENAFNSELFNDVRSRMENNESVPECHICWNQEDAGAISMRNEMNERFDINANKKLRYIETAFSTHCNLTCRMCNEDFSSKWKQLIYPNIKPDLNINNFDLDKYDSDLSELKLVKLVGGEPMIDKNHVPFLEKLFSQSKEKEIELEYHTNATISPNKKVIEFWKQASKVTINFSIDGVGEVNEILRPPHKWETIVKTLDFFKSIENVNFNFRIHTVISILNVRKLHEIIGFAMQEFGNDPISFGFLEYPKHLSVQNTTDKTNLIDFVTENYLPLSPNVKSLISHIAAGNNDTLYSLSDVIEIENKSLVNGDVGKLL